MARKKIDNGDEGGLSQPAETGHLRPAASVAVSTIVSALQELGGKRRYYMQVANGLEHTAKNAVRRALGHRPDMEDASRAALNLRAAKIATAILNGKPVIGEDEEWLSDVYAYVLVCQPTWRAASDQRKSIEKQMRALARQLPVWLWCETVRGLGEMGVASIISEAGDPAAYETRDKFRKRMGWAPTDSYPKGEKSEGRMVPRSRKGRLFGDVTQPLFFAQGQLADATTGEVKREAGPYRIAYDRRRMRTAETHPEWTKAHSHADGLRVMTQRLLDDVWQAQREAIAEVPSRAPFALPPASSIAAA